MLTGLILTFSLAAGSLRAEEGTLPAAETQSVTDAHDAAEVVMTPPTSYDVQTVLLFPLEIPRYVLRTVLWPVGATINVARQLDLDDAYSEKTDTFYLQPYIVFGGGAAFGVGARFLKERLIDDHWSLEGYGQIHTNLNHGAGLKLTREKLFTLAGGPVNLNIGSKYRNQGNRVFYGIGNDTPESDRTEYSYYNIDAGVSLDYNVYDDLYLEPFVIYRASLTDSKRGGDDPPSSNDVFPSSVLIGFDEWVQHLDIGLRFRHDTLDNKWVPRRGGIQEFRFSRMQGLDNNFSYYELVLDAYHFFPLWAERRTIGISGTMKLQETTGDNEIPFNRKANLGLDSPLRGFRTGRFTDNSYILFNVEYRYPIWDYIDAVVFVDTGRVFDGLENISLKNIKYSVGGGIWFITKKFYFARLEAGWGGEGVRIYMRVNRSI